MAPQDCPEPEFDGTDPSKFLDDGNITWKRHYIGWTVAGVCALIATLISLRLMYKHAKNYTNVTFLSLSPSLAGYQFSFEKETVYSVQHELLIYS